MANRLILEKSPYLLQHAHNPVDWYAWGEEAFSRARQEDKPIFLSIGYSTCHWCHVMERESFEDEGVAGLLNRDFVPIKVDREERPDVDRIYMTALQAMGHNGGWPMSMFLAPDLRPFWGGTYFPPESRYGRAGFPDILRRIAHVWKEERSKVLEAAGGIATYLNDLAHPAVQVGSVSEEVLHACYRQLSGSYDAEEGGFGNGPKFPRPSVFTFLLRYAARTGESRARNMVEHTIRRMATGGMYDHVGGGFHRYAVDRSWRVPHFEKMLYDQAQLVIAYLETYQETGDPFFADVARDTLRYVLRDMTTAEKAFASAEDADSPRPEDPNESGEGAFYVWQNSEIETILGADAGLFAYAYGVEPEGNAPFDPQQEFLGRNILFVDRPPEAVAGHFRLSLPEVEEKLSVARMKLLDVRKLRPRPLRDDKVLVSWNGLMISALARSGMVLGDDTYIRAGADAAGFLLDALVDHDTGRLFHRHRDGEARFNGSLEDYAFFVSGLLDLFSATGHTRWKEEALRLSDLMLDLFGDAERGGFYETSGGEEHLLVRMREHYDGAEPSGNAVAALNLLRLAHLTGEGRWRNTAERLFAAFSPWLTKQPGVMPYLAASFAHFLEAPRHVVIAGSWEDPGAAALRREAFLRFRPELTIVHAVTGGGAEGGTGLPDFARGMGLVDGRAAAYVCENFTCRLPVTDPSVLRTMLGGTKGSSGESHAS
jgi:hypothetical protein